jgi:RNA polymerase sigma factor (sigma-70 family)
MPAPDTMSEDQGLDIAKHYDTIRKTLESQFHDAPLGVDELTQRVCHKILKMNQGSSPYDPSRSSIPRYVHVIANSIISDHVNKKSNQCETPFDPFEDKISDEPEFPIQLRSFQSDDFADFLKDRLDWDDTQPRRVYLLMRLGYKRSEIADILDEKRRTISWYRKKLKRLLSEYIEERPEEKL